MKIKGIIFPSFKEPPNSTWNPTPKLRPRRSLPEGKAWVAHSGLKARVRILRQSCRNILSSKDPIDIALLKQTREVVSAGPYQEYGILSILFKAQQDAILNDLSWQETLEYILEGLKIDPPKEDLKIDPPEV